MAMMGWQCTAVVLALSCLSSTAVEHAVSIDAVSMMQMTVARTRLQASKKTAASSKLFKSIIVPYKKYAEDRSDISDLPEELSQGQLLAYEPTSAKNSDLFVFLPGSWTACGNYSQLLETVGASMNTVCLPYDNMKAIFQQCGDDGLCWAKKRVDASSGDFNNVTGNNIEHRLKTALDFLAKEHGASWGEFIAGPEELKLWPKGLKFEKMRVSGHSQGAGNAAMLAYQHEVSRVVQFSGPCDTSEWPATMHKETPSSRFFGIASSFDHMCDWQAKQIPNWYKQGIISPTYPNAVLTEQNLTAFDPGKAQTIIAQITSPGSCDSTQMLADMEKAIKCSFDSHSSTALNMWEEHGPYADGLWQKLVGI